MANLLRLFAFIGLVLSGYLLVLKLTGAISSVVGCGAGSGCENVLGSKWSQFFGIPVSAFSLLIYGGLIWASFSRDRRSLATLLSCLLLAAAVWFVGLQLLVVKAFCPWCVATHVIGIATAGLVFLVNHGANRRGETFRTSKEYSSSISAAAVFTAFLAAGQLWGPAPDTHQLDSTEVVQSDDSNNQEPGADVDSDADPENLDGTAEPAVAHIHERGEGRKVDFQDKQFSVTDLPFIGKPDAPKVMVKYFDYTCKSCKEMEEDLKVLMKAYPDQFAVILLPTPLNRACNEHLPARVENHEHACELARLSLAAWKSNPELFPQVHELLFSRPIMTPEKAQQEVEALLAPGKLEIEEHQAWIDELIEANITDYRQLCFRSIVMPKLRVKKGRVLSGLVKSTEEFVELIENVLRPKKQPAK